MALVVLVGGAVTTCTLLVKQPASGMEAMATAAAHLRKARTVTVTFKLAVVRSVSPIGRTDFGGSANLVVGGDGRVMYRATPNLDDRFAETGQVLRLGDQTYLRSSAVELPAGKVWRRVWPSSLPVSFSLLDPMFLLDNRSDLMLGMANHADYEDSKKSAYDWGGVETDSGSPLSIWARQNNVDGFVVRVVIDQAGRATRVHMTIKARDFNILLTMDLSDYGAAVTISAPPAAEIA
jgi:hypothetical protein